MLSVYNDESVDTFSSFLLSVWPLLKHECEVDHKILFRLFTLVRKQIASVISIVCSTRAVILEKGEFGQV